MKKALFTILFVCIFSTLAYASDFATGLLLGVASCDSCDRIELKLAENITLQKISDSTNDEQVVIRERTNCNDHWYGVTCDDAYHKYTFLEYAKMTYPKHEYLGVFKKNSDTFFILREKK